MLLLSLLAAACVASNEMENKPSALNLIMCEEPRPQLCTREYNPVCAALKNGSTRTAATGCTACADSEVTGYIMGACESISVE